MAADTPSILGGNRTLKRTDVAQFHKVPYSGAGTQRESRWQLATDSAFTAVKADTLLRENDDRTLGDDWWEIAIDSVTGLASTMYLRCLVRNTSSESSAYSPTITLTIAASALTAAQSRAAQ